MDSVLLIITAYLIGAFPFVYLLGRLRGYNLRKEEDMHLGIWRKVGHTEGGIAMIWELMKGVAVVLVADKAVHFETWAVASAGLATVAGQMWSVFLSFEGEKGNSTGIGMAAALAPLACVFALIPVLTGVIIKVTASLQAKSKAVKRSLGFSGSATLAMPLGMLGGFIVFP